MSTGLITINILFVLLVLVVIPGPLIWAIRTAHRDHQTVIEPVVAPAAEPELVIEEPLLPEVALA